MGLPLVLKPGEGRLLDVFDLKLSLKATTSETNGTYSLIEGVWQPGGFGPLPHIHKDKDESFYVLDGQFDFHIGDDTIRAEEGAFLIVPRGILHSFAAVGNSAARLLFLHAPPLDGFFLELEKLSDGGPPNPSKIRALMGRWGMEAPAS